MDEVDEEREFDALVWGPDFRPDDATRTLIEGDAVQVVVVDGTRTFRGLEFPATALAVIRRSDGRVLEVRVIGGQNGHASGPELRKSVERMAQAICDGSIG